MSLARERRIWEARAAAFDRQGLRRELRFVAEDPLWGWVMGLVAERGAAWVLDAGCGWGATTALLAPRVRRAVGVDISFASLAAGRALAGEEACSPGFAAGSLEALPFASGSFDAVVGRFVLHHAESLEATAAEIWRVLRPGGWGAFVETWGRNPLLRMGRDLTALAGVGLGTPDERPLGAEEIEVLGRWFGVELHYPRFVAFELLSRFLRRGAPLARRSTWFRDRLSRLWAQAIAADRAIERRLPAARSWGWYVGLVLARRE